MRRATAVYEGIGVVLALILAVVCWNAGVDVHQYAAVPDGAPAYASTQYSGSWIAVATVSVLVAGLLAVDAIRRTVSMRSHTR